MAQLLGIAVKMGATKADFDATVLVYATEGQGVGDGPKVYGLRTGVLNQRATLRPTLQIWHRSALPWVESTAELPTIPGQP